MYAIGGYDGTCNLNSVEYYDPETNQWTIVASMDAHEGVVGVGVLPNDIDLNNEESENELSSSFIQAPYKHLSTATTKVPFANNVNMKNYYSLMEEEEEENQYQSLITQSKMNFP